jgi:glycosyltransferase 2 family protein
MPLAARLRHRLFRRDPSRVTRRATDALRLVVAAVTLSGLALHAGHETTTERAVVRAVSSLPPGLETPLLALYGLAALWAVGLLGGALFVARRPRLARDIVIAGVAAWAVGRVLGSLVRHGDVGRALDTLVTIGSTPRFPLTRVAVVTAVVIVASPHLSRPVRRIGQSLVGLLTFAALFLATAFPGDLLGAIVLGWAVASLVHLVFGVPVMKPGADEVRRALERLGLRDVILSRAAGQTGTATRFVGRDHLGAVDVEVLGRDDVDARALTLAGRWVAYRHEEPTFFATRRQRVEHEAYALLLARAAGVSVPQIAAAGAADSRLAVLATRRVDGITLTDADPASLAAALLVETWRHVGALHAAGIAHGKLGARAVVVDLGAATGGRVTLVDFASATTAATERSRTADVAELLAATTALVGARRATDAAIEGVGAEAVIEALPLLQAPALSAETRAALGDRKEGAATLDALRETAAEHSGTAVPDLQRLQRVQIRTLAMVIGTLVGIAILFNQIGDPGTLWATLREADRVFVVVAIVAAFATNVAFALAFLGTVPDQLAFAPVFWLQVAMGFSNVALPAGAETAVQVRFLQKQGLDLASALAVGGILSTVSEVVIQLALFGVALLLGPSAVDIGDVPTGSMAAVALGVVLVLCVVAAVVFSIRRIRRAVLPHVIRAARTMWDAIRTPSRIALLLVGNISAQLLYAGTLLACLHAYGSGASFWTLLALNIGISTIAGLVPVPGGDTAVSTIGMSGALVATGVPEATAAAAVLTNTIVTSYLPAIPGWFATQFLVRRQLL